MTRKLRCTVQYDGTDFAGFQRQPGRETVQGALELAITRVTQAPVTVTAAGRTDAGVHALGQVVHFETVALLSCTALQRGINACLPESVAVSDLTEAPAAFHARFDALSREYRYVVMNAASRSPLLRARALHVPSALDIGSMQAAAATLRGRHDFAAFGAAMEHTRQPAAGGAPATVRGNTIRTMLEVGCWRRQRFVLFCFIADAFLRHMVRMLVGTLLRIGSGRLPVGALAALLCGDRSIPVGPAVPACGLYLVRVRYS